MLHWALGWYRVSADIKFQPKGNNSPPNFPTKGIAEYCHPTPIIFKTVNYTC